MPARSRRSRSSTGPSTAATDWMPGSGGHSNSAMQEQLSNQPAAEVRADPLPWGPQNRSVSYQSAQGSQLFQDGATPNDVVQGRNGSRYLGDCWLLASLAALAQTQPRVLEQAITDHEDGTYTVRLYGEDASGSLTAEDVRVQGTIPKTGDGRDAYAQRADPSELWVVIIEKAFAAWKGGYGGLHAGVPSAALTALTGQQATNTFTKGTSSEALGETFRESADEGRAMVAASRPDLSLERGGIIPGHAHTIMRVEGTGENATVTLRDPYAEYEPDGNGPRDGVFQLTMQEFRSRFDYFSSSSEKDDGTNKLW